MRANGDRSTGIGEAPGKHHAVTADTPSFMQSTHHQQFVEPTEVRVFGVSNRVPLVKACSRADAVSRCLFLRQGMVILALFPSGGIWSGVGTSKRL